MNRPAPEIRPGMAGLDLQRLIDGCDLYTDRQHLLLDELLARGVGAAHAVTAQLAALEQLDAAIRDAHLSLLARRAWRA